MEQNLLKKKITFNLKEITQNLKSNSLLIISTLALITLHLLSKTILIAQIISFILAILTFTQINNLFEKTKKINKTFKIFAGISTLGILYYIRSLFVLEVCNFNVLINFIQKTNINQTLFLDKISYSLMIFSSLILYTLIVLLFDYLSNIYKNIFNNLSKAEKITYPIFILFILVFVSTVFYITDVFYSGKIPMDTIFTSDSGVLVETNTYMRLYHLENDIRQPLAAVFSMPFIGISYALSLIIPFSPIIEPLLMNLIQVLLLIFCNFVIAKILNLNSITRLLFVILTMCTYMNLIFLFTMEQYIFAYFWLVTLLYTLYNKQENLIALVGSGGTLITSLFLTLWFPQNISKDNIKKYILKLILAGITFLFFLALFGRIDIFFPQTLEFKTGILSGFVSKEITLLEKLKQYSIFIKNCFIKPDVIITYTNISTLSFQLKEAISFSITGIILLALSIIGFFLTKKEKISQISFSWILFSILLLVVIGWGAIENGMILYSLYFGWAFLILQFQLIKVMCSKLKSKALLPTILLILIVILLIFNIQGILELLNFAFTNFSRI